MQDIIYSGASPVLMPREDPVGKIVFALVLFVFFMVCFVALMTFLAAVFRETNERAKSAIQNAPLWTLLIGVVGYAVPVCLAALLFSEAFVVRLLETETVSAFLAAAVIVAALPLLLSLLGAPSLFSYVGDRLAQLRGGEMNDIRRTAAGTLMSVFAALFPIVGWFVVTPCLLALSFGAGASGVFRRKIAR